MNYDFDEIIERRDTDSVKWGIFSRDVLPLWVADMDFRSAEPIIQALKCRMDHGVFGYSRPSERFTQAIQERMLRLYKWKIDSPAIVFIPGIVTGINIAIQAFSIPGEAILAQPPVYFHFFRDPVHHGRILQDPPLIQKGDSYEIDFDQFEDSITTNTRVFLLCNPHNPVGRVYTKAELEKLADICLRHGLIICSDEIHCDLVYSPHRHIPIATLDREVEARTVTLMAPSKTFNIAGFECGYAMITNAELRKRWKDFSYGIIPGINIAGHVAALAAFDEGQEWLEQVLEYLLKNRNYLSEFLRQEMPVIRMSRVEGTYLAWLDCREANIPEKPSEFFLKHAQVALNDGAEFGRGGDHFIRLNFACPRKRLMQALHQMKQALEISKP
jgi:cysteine-S-conjugate beta-lyase